MNPNQDDTTTPAGAGPDPVEVLDDENGRLHDDPRIPSRAELDALYLRDEARGWDEQSARAWEYLDGRREIADERAAAVERGDTDTVARLDRQHALMDQNYIGLARGQQYPGLTAPDEPSVIVLPDDLDRELVRGQPRTPHDIGALRARIATLSAQRGAGDDAGDGLDQVRRAQLAAWADDDRHSLGIGSTDGRSAGDEDGA